LVASPVKAAKTWLFVATVFVIGIVFVVLRLGFKVVDALIAWVACLDEIRRNDPANLEDLPTASTTLILTFSAALQNVRVAS
jgi:hypothetical protein